VKVLLDENFPLALHRSLETGGVDVEHIITLGWRGASDQRIRERLVDHELLFLTQDEDFLFSKPAAAVIVLSRVRQARPLPERVEIWLQAIRHLTHNPRPEPRFELLDDGSLLPWEPGPGNTWVAKLPRAKDDAPSDRK